MYIISLDVVYPGLRPEHLYLFFAYINKKKFLAFFQNIEQFLSYIKLLLIMSVNEANPELELLKQRITELEAENAELRKGNTEISNHRIKLSVSDAEIAELKHRNAEVL